MISYTKILYEDTCNMYKANSNGIPPPTDFLSDGRFILLNYLPWTSLKKLWWG